MIVQYHLTSKFRRDVGKWGSSTLLISAAMGMSFLLFSPHSTGGTESYDLPKVEGQTYGESHRICTKCSQTKRIGHGGDFAIKGRTSRGIRWDSVCLICKADAQKLRRQKSTSQSQLV
jgi:hypothetical protein